MSNGVSERLARIEAVAAAGGNERAAARLLRYQAEESLHDALAALRAGTGRVRPLMGAADRRLRLAADLEEL